jgi:nicotinamidase-related amidase
MKRLIFPHRLLLAASVALGLLSAACTDTEQKQKQEQEQEQDADPEDETIQVSLRQHAVVMSEQWKPSETAIIICDMWNRHWCDSATARVAKMAPVMNDVLTAARNKGVAIVHAPSDCMAFYKSYPQRQAAATYKDKRIAALAQGDELPSEAGAEWPVDQSDGGCDGDGIVNDPVWTRQHKALIIADHDFISDSGEEIGAYFEQKGIKNVILMGVHTNMCIVNRSFGLRAMTRLDMNVVLMRDMTDLMYNPSMYPYVDHFEGLDLIIEYIEAYICPTIVSTDLTGLPPFVFALMINTSEIHNYSISLS